MKNIEHVLPKDIERRSFEIITEELSAKGIVLESDKEAIIKRAIHTTADFDYADTMIFSEGAVEKIKSLIRGGVHIITDTNMALTGINKKELARYGVEAKCYMADEEVAKEATERGLTRASVSMQKASLIDGDVIFVVGNAPTALITLRNMLDEGKYRPAFIIGVPVGFVNVVEAKELIIETDIPYIINRGRKGGSNVAAAIVNAVLYELRDSQ